MQWKVPAVRYIYGHQWIGKPNLCQRNAAAMFLHPPTNTRAVISSQCDWFKQLVKFHACFSLWTKSPDMNYRKSFFDNGSFYVTCLCFCGRWWGVGRPGIDISLLPFMLKNVIPLFDWFLFHLLLIDIDIYPLFNIVGTGLREGSNTQSHSVCIFLWISGGKYCFRPTSW